MIPCIQIVDDPTPADTILPSDYLMTYPGSYWKYEYESSGTISVDSCLSWELVSFTKHKALTNCTGIYKDYKIIASTNYGYIAGWEQFFAGPTSNDSCGLIKIIDTIPGVFYDNDRFFANSEFADVYKNEFIEAIPSMTVSGVVYTEVIHIKAFYQRFFFDISMGPTWLFHNYYAKNVGKIRTEIYYNNNQTPYGISNLIEYHIAPH